MKSDTLSGWIEFASLIMAETVGLYIYYSLGGPAGLCLAYGFGVASGALGVRLAEVWRESQVTKRIQDQRA